MPNQNRVFHQQPNKFWSFASNSDGTAELLLYGPIAQEASWFEDVISPQQFANDLAALGNVSQITVRVNSGGGDPLAASAILTQLKAHPADIIVQIEGIAASAAALFLPAGKVIIPDYAQVMIHNPKMQSYKPLGVEDMQRLISALESIKDGFLNAMTTKTGLDRKALSKMMDEETWMTGSVAVEKGFADELMFNESGSQTAMSMKDDVLFVNSVAVDLSMYKTRPTIPNSAAVVPPASGVEIKTNEQGEKTQMEITTVAELKTNLPAIHDEVFNSALAAGKNEGAEAERNRLKAFDVLNGKVDADFLAEEKYKPGATAENVLFKAVQEGKMVNAAYVAQAEKDAATANQVPGAGEQFEQHPEAKMAKTEEVGILNAVKTVAENVIQTLKGGK